MERAWDLVQNIKRTHVPIVGKLVTNRMNMQYGTVPVSCDACDSSWPCDASELAHMVEYDPEAVA